MNLARFLVGFLCFLAGIQPETSLHKSIKCGVGDLYVELASHMLLAVYVCLLRLFRVGASVASRPGLFPGRQTEGDVL